MSYPIALGILLHIGPGNGIASLKGNKPLSQQVTSHYLNQFNQDPVGHQAINWANVIKEVLLQSYEDDFIGNTQDINH